MCVAVGDSICHLFLYLIVIGQDIPTLLYLSTCHQPRPQPTTFHHDSASKPHTWSPHTFKTPRLPQRQNQRQTPKPLSKSTPVFRAPLPNSPAKVTDNKKSGVIALPATPSPQPRQVKHTKNRVQNQRWLGIFGGLGFFLSFGLTIR